MCGGGQRTRLKYKKCESQLVPELFNPAVLKRRTDGSMPIQGQEWDKAICRNGSRPGWLLARLTKCRRSCKEWRGGSSRGTRERCLHLNGNMHALRLIAQTGCCNGLRGVLAFGPKEKPMKKIAALFAFLPVFACAQLSDENERLVQKLVGTNYVTFQRDTSEGNLKACGVEFMATGRDINKGAAPYKIHGSYYLRQFPDGLYWMLKLGVEEFDSKLLNTTMFAPPTAYVSGKNKPVAKPIRSIKSDGYSLHLFKMGNEANMAMESIFTLNQLDIIFSRGTKTDVITPVDFRVKGTTFVAQEAKRELTSETTKQLSECTVQLIDSYKSTPEQKK